MSTGAKAYYNVATKTMSARELEASLLLKAAGKFQSVKDDWDNRKAELDEALNYNRRLWTILLSSVTDPASPLPQDIRDNVANIGVFILKRTLDVMIEPSPEKLNALISLNRNLAAGLHGNGTQAG
jgi:flagellar protein FlaF